MNKIIEALRTALYLRRDDRTAALYLTRNDLTAVEGEVHDLVREALHETAALRTRIANACRAGRAEIYQFHSTAYPSCKGGCPGEEALKLLDELLEEIDQ